MTARLVFNTAEDTVFIFNNMRAADRAEMKAAMGEVLFEKLPMIVGTARPYVWTALLDEKPAALVGWRESKPGVVSVFAFGTQDWSGVVVLLTRHILRYMIPDLLNRGIHRAECAALSSREDVQKWMGVLGGRPRAVLQQWGTNKEDFTVYSWLADDFPRET